MVFELLAPAGEEAAEAVEPGVGAFDHPAAGAEPSVAFELFLLFAARADVAGERELDQQLVDGGVVVALVEAEPLLARIGVRPFDQDAFEGGAEEFEVVDVRAVDLEPDRDAAAFAEDGAFRPLLALSVGFGPVPSPPSGALPIAPSQDSHAHSIPFASS